jgi:hypothetical protein
MARYRAMAVERTAWACSQLACRSIQNAETTVAVGLKGTHAEFLGQREGLLVVGLGQCTVWGVDVQGDLPEKP